MIDSHGLVLRNQLDQTTHRCGAALDVILTTSPLVCQVTVQHGSSSCPVAPLCCPLFASDHVLCSCPLYLPHANQPSQVAPRARLVSRSCFWPTAFGHLAPVILSDCASVASLPRSSRSRACSRRRQPRWSNDACYHALIARNCTWRDLRRSGSEDDYVRFHHTHRQFHSVIRSSRASFWMTGFPRCSPSLAETPGWPHSTNFPILCSLDM